MKTRIILFLLCFCTLSAAGLGITRQKCAICGKLKVQCPGHEAKCRSCGKVVSKCPYNGKHPSKPSISSPTSYENGYGYVDLGLSVKWATCNVGASTPTDYGSYFAWGETRTKSTYNWDTYFDSVNGSSSNFNKYATNKKTTLDLSDDAAYANWGGSWRMPTRAEQDELREKCTWTWTTQNGVKGYKVSSKRNSNSIFLPAAGFRLDSSLGRAGSSGGCWSSSLNTSFPFGAYGLGFGSGDVDRGNYYRYSGRSVRAVCP